MDINRLSDNLSRYAANYSPARLFPKIKKVARKVGSKMIFTVLIIYYATFDKNIPVKDRLMLAGALGYFILPVDLIPDMLPGGFADDAAALAYVARHIWNNLSSETIAKARRSVREMFPDVDADTLTLTDTQSSSDSQ